MALVVELQRIFTEWILITLNPETGKEVADFGIQHLKAYSSTIEKPLTLLRQAGLFLQACEAVLYARNTVKRVN